MKFAIIKVVNGAFSVHAEGISAIENAKTQFHAVCQTLWNAQDAITASVKIVDENLSCVEGYAEYIRHETISG